MSVTKIFLIAVVIVTAVVGVWIGRRYVTQRSAALMVDDLETWRSLSEKSTAWLNERKFLEIKKVENAALTSLPSRPAAVFFATFAINCAKSRRLGGYGDPYVFLLKGEEALGTDVAEASRATLLYDLASEHYLINCYHRAFRLLDSIPENQRNPQITSLRNKLTKLFSLFRTTTAELDQTTAAKTGDQALSQQLRDLLGIIPENIFYSEHSLVSKNEDLRVEQNIVDKHQRLALTLPPIGISCFRPLKRLPPWPKAITDTEEEQSAQQEQSVENDQSASESPFVTLDLSVSERRTASDLLSRSRSTGVLDTSSAAFKTFARSILSQSSSENTSESLTANDLQQSLTKGPYLALVFTKSSETTIYFVIGTSPDSLRVLSWKSFADEFQLADVTGDGAADLIVRSRQGSGGFLNVTVINPLTGETIFEQSDLLRGEVRMIDIDNDPALELLVTERTELQRRPCNQCPARYVMTVFDYDSRDRKYKAIGRKLSYGELNSLASLDMFGLSEIELASGDRLPGAKARIREILATLKKQETPAWSTDVQLELKQLFTALDSAQDRATAVSRDKLDLQTALVQTLDRPDLPPSWMEMRRAGQLWRVHTLIQMREPERALELTSEPWLLESAKTSPEARAEILNVNGISNQLLGRMSYAYDSYTNALKELQQLAPETAYTIEGNLSYYFSTLGDTSNAYMYAQRALDHAIMADNADSASENTPDESTVVAADESATDERVTQISQSQALDMMHLATFALRSGDQKQALDWISRALRFGRRDANSAIATGALRLAADIALANNWPDLALQLLDESVLGTNELAWQTEGGAVFLVYGRAVNVQHNPQQAIELLRVSAKLSQGVDATTHCLALYSISRILKDLGDTTQALAYARLAFEAITTGRRSVSLEEQKFSFLADKRTIASWLFQLLIETKQDPLELLWAVESWKMRTFLDLHDDKMAGLGAPLTETELTSRLAAILDEGDLLLDYVALESSGIVLIVTKSQGVQVYKVPATPAHIAALRSKALKAFDIREPSSLAAIRNDTVDPELADTLGKLYVETLGFIQIPTGIRRLLIAPDEFLFGVPWPALKPSNTEYLADRYELVLIPSAVVAIGVNNVRPDQSRSQRTLIACALGGVKPAELTDGVDESQPKVSYAPLARLNDGWTECEKVEAALKDTEVELLGDTETLKQQGRFSENSVATPERFLAKAPGARIIHMVGHGIYDLKQPMQSKLFLDNGRSGRVVRASDFLPLNLTGVELVTLAACQSGQYGGMVGAEPLGFLRALLGAGASSVLLTNWEADDKTTADLLSEFYSRLHYTRKSTALREAQVTTKQRLKHPYFWAAHSLYGNWN